MGQEAMAADTHEDIMSATYHALRKRGYADLTMQDIADEFDKSRSLLHYHYDTKEELMLAFVDHMVGWLGERLEESGADDPLARLEDFVDRMVVEPGTEDRETFIVALLELRVQAVHNEAFREKLAVHYESNVATVADIVADGVEQSVFREVDPERVGEVVYTALWGALVYQVTLGAERASLRMRDAVAAFVVEDLLVDDRSTAPYQGGDFGR